MFYFFLFCLSVFILSNIQPKHSDVRLIFSLIAGVSMSLMAAARPVAFEQFSDTDVYYGIYRAICDGDMSVLTLYGGGFEVGISVLFFLLSLISSNLSINGMMFFLSLFSIILFIVWLCRVSAQEAPQKQALLLGISLLMINLDRKSTRLNSSH